VTIAVNSCHSSKSESKLMRIDGKIKHFDVKCLVDTGATSSIIPHKIALNCNLSINDSDIKIKTADGKVSPIVGITETTLLEIKEKQVAMKFLVIDNDSNFILLGQDWLDITKAILWPCKNDISFPCDESLGNEAHGNLDSLLDQEQKLEKIYLFDNFSVNSSVSDDDVYTQPDWGFEKERREVKFESTFSEEIERFLDKELRKAILERSAFSLADLNEKPDYEHEIRTEPHAPIYMPRPRMSLEKEEIIEKEIQLMLKHGIIAVSKSPYSFMISLIMRDLVARVCVNFILLNKVTITQHLPMPRPQDIFDRIAGSIWFTLLDLMRGFWQLWLKKNSIEKTGFTSKSGHYHF